MFTKEYCRHGMKPDKREAMHGINSRTGRTGIPKLVGAHMIPSQASDARGTVVGFSLYPVSFGITLVLPLTHYFLLEWECLLWTIAYWKYVNCILILQ